MKFAAVPLGTAVLVLTLTTAALAHGMNYHLVDGTAAIGFRAAFTTGEAMCFCETEIFAPDEPESYASGLTDQEGRFFFQPDRPGEWRAVVNGGMGHRLAFAFPVDNAGHASRPQGDTGDVPLWIKAVFGLSLLANLFLGLGLFRRRP